MSKLLLRLAIMVALCASQRAHATDGDLGRAAAVLDALACQSCHLPGPSMSYLFADFETFSRTPAPPPSACARCHVGNWVAATSSKPAPWLPLSPNMLGRITRFHAYVETPPISFREQVPDGHGGAQLVRRYTDCGLEAFLAAPVPRRSPARQSMYPVTSERRRQLTRALDGAVEPCRATPPATAAQQQRGATLFVGSGCAGCHAGRTAAPRLRIGVALLSSAYFRARVRHGGPPAEPRWQRVWQSAANALHAIDAPRLTMPAHPDLSEQDLDALYAYVSRDRSDLPSYQPEHAAPYVDVPPELGRKLFRDIQQRVFDTSCRHCHASGRRDQQLVRRVFGTVKGGTPGVLPMSNAPTPSREQLRGVLGESCETSPLLLRLRQRAREWSGHAGAGEARGMPLTLPPLSEDAIRLVETWRAVGCPSDIGDLCPPCQPGGA